MSSVVAPLPFEIENLPAPPQPNQPNNPVVTFLLDMRQWVYHLVSISVVVVVFLVFVIINKVKHHHHSPLFICNPNVSVALDGSGLFTSVSAAVAGAPDMSSTPHCIYIQKGVYRETITIGKNKQNIALVGEDPENTIIQSGETTTINVFGAGFIAVNLTFENFGDAQMGVVVLYNEGDASMFYKCNFHGNASTLFAVENRQFYRDCNIYGKQSMISGNARSIFQNCTIHVSPASGTKVNVIASQGGSEPKSRSGHIFQHCKIVPAPGMKALGANTYLGSTLGQYSTVVFMRSYMGELVNPSGWIINKTTKIYFGEFENGGPGSNTKNRTPWPGVKVINSSEAAQFTVRDFIQGNEWLPKGIPYWADLVEIPGF